MIVEYTRYSNRNSFEEAYQRASAFLAASVHCISNELSRCTEDANTYVLRIEWDSKEGHLKGFRASPEFKAFFAIVQPYTKNIEEMRHSQVLTAGSRAIEIKT